MRHAAWLPLLALLCLALSACGGGASGADVPIAPGTSSLKIYVTDAPFPGDLVQSATVTIKQVQVRETSGGGWQTVFDGSATIDLVPLRGGVTSLLAEAELDPGTYDEVRLIVEAGEVILEPEAIVAGDSHVFNSANGGLHFPSGAQTGIKVKVDNDIVVVTELSSDLTLDFDLSRNFVFNGPMTHAPGVRRVIFTPVVRAVNSSVAGTVEMEIWSDNFTPGDTADDVTVANADVRAIDEADPTAPPAGGPAGADGFYSLQLAPGTYTIEIEAAGHTLKTIAGVQVALGNLTRLGPVLLEATAGEISGTILSDGGTATDTADDLVLEGATVTATPQAGGAAPVSVTTDNQGAFRFADLAAGTYDLIATMPDFVDSLPLAATPTSGGTTVTITLEALKRNLTGAVTDADDNAIEDVDVTVVNAAGDEVAATTTAPDGSYAIVLGTGVYDVTFNDSVTGNTNTVSVTIVGDTAGSDHVLNQVL